jgi:hypothetical protein
MKIVKIVKIAKICKNYTKYKNDKNNTNYKILKIINIIIYKLENHEIIKTQIKIFINNVEMLNLENFDDQNKGQTQYSISAKFWAKCLEGWMGGRKIGF